MGPRWQVTSSLRRNGPVQNRESGPSEGRLAIIGGQKAGLFWRAVSRLAPSPHKPRGANLDLLSDDSPGSSILHPLTPLLGLTQEEEGNILLLLIIVLTLPF